MNKKQMAHENSEKRLNREKLVESVGVFRVIAKELGLPESNADEMLKVLQMGPDEYRRWIGEK